MGEIDWRKKGLARVKGKNLSGRGRSLSALESSLWICSGGGTQEARGQEAVAKERNEESWASAESMALSSSVILLWFSQPPFSVSRVRFTPSFSFISFYLKKNYLAMWILTCSMQILSWGMWDLVPWPGIESRPSVLWAQSLSRWNHQRSPYVFTF